VSLQLRYYYKNPEVTLRSISMAKDSLFQPGAPMYRGGLMGADTSKKKTAQKAVKLSATRKKQLEQMKRIWGC
jgi:hypothetical protein